MELKELMNRAEKAFRENFPMTTCFERALFFSWYCSIRDCRFCFMSTQPDNPRYRDIAIRSMPSLLAETIICKEMGWNFGFLSGGISSFKSEKFLELLKNINSILGEKIWINIGPVSVERLKKFSPYLKGVVASVETVNQEVRDYACPSKPVKPYLSMFEHAAGLGLKKAVTIILGIGEGKGDFPKLAELIRKHGIEKIHFYGLNPQKGTEFEKSEPPSPEYQAWWIAMTRVSFPKIDIQMGIWKDRVDRVSMLLKAGSNSISKFPAIRKFNSLEAQKIEGEAVKGGRIFTGSLTKLPDIDIERYMEQLPSGNKLKKQVKAKLKQYLDKMKHKDAAAKRDKGRDS